jgi:hypothetical protein
VHFEFLDAVHEHFENVPVFEGAGQLEGTGRLRGGIQLGARKRVRQHLHGVQVLQLHRQHQRRVARLVQLVPLSKNKLVRLTI